jgi:hypothetical protein
LRTGVPQQQEGAVEVLGGERDDGRPRCPDGCASSGSSGPLTAFSSEYYEGHIFSIFYILDIYWDLSNLSLNISPLLYHLLQPPKIQEITTGIYSNLANVEQYLV